MKSSGLTASPLRWIIDVGPSVGSHVRLRGANASDSAGKSRRSGSRLAFATEIGRDVQLAFARGNGAFRCEGTMDRHARCDVCLLNQAVVAAASVSPARTGRYPEPITDDDLGEGCVNCAQKKAVRDFTHATSNT